MSPAIDIGRHHADEFGAVLAAIGFGQLDADDLGNHIGFVGRLKRAGQRRILPQVLGCELRMDTGRTEKHQLLHAMEMRGVDHVRGDHDVVHSVRNTLLATMPPTGQEDDLRPRFRKPVEHGGLVTQSGLVPNRP